jgi:fructokinase
MNLVRTKIPPVLLEAMADPYARPPGKKISCETLIMMVAPLDLALGEDVDRRPPEDNEDLMDRSKRMAAKSDILKFSDEDLEWFGLEGGHDDLAAYWLKHGAKLVVITKGAEGASGYTNERKVTVPSERVTVVDTVGAGDTFDAGVLASWKMDNLLTKTQVASLDEKALTNALALGAKAAAVTVSRAGANPPWAREIGL